MKEKSDLMDAIELNDCRLHVLGAIKGLENEMEKVKKSFELSKPDLIAVSLSKEDLRTLKNFEGKVEDAKPDNFEEVIYIRELKKWGEVKKPPPCYLAAVGLGKEHNVTCRAIDMNDEEYTDAFCRNVGTFELYRHSWSAKKLMKRKFKALTPEDFVIEYDKAITRLEGYRALELAREKHMAEKLRQLSRDRKSILAVVELERAEGLKEILKK
jgi:pheromone shutdown protein TraB